jgi:hypothetical protein
MHYKALIAALLAAPLAGCFYHGSGTSVISLSMVHRLLPGPATESRGTGESRIGKADPRLDHLFYRAPQEQARHQHQLGALIHAALKQAKSLADSELCGREQPIRAQIVEQVGPTLADTAQGRGWFFRLSWKSDARPVCDEVSPEQYYLTFSRHLPGNMVIYRAAPEGHPPALYRAGERVQDPLTLIDVG